MSTAWLRRGTSKFDVLWRTWTYEDEFSFLFLNFLNEFNSRESGLHLTYWAGPNRRDYVSLKERKFFFFSDVFTADVVAFLKVPCSAFVVGERIRSSRVNAVSFNWLHNMLCIPHLNDVLDTCNSQHIIPRIIRLISQVKKVYKEITLKTSFTHCFSFTK